MSLSSSKVEYAALSEAFKEVMFMIQLLGSMKIVVKYPVTVRVGNVSATLMANDITTTCHTKHVDIRYKYVNEYVVDGVVNIVFLRSADDDNNILTKNLSAEPHEMHSRKVMGEKSQDVVSFKKL